MTPFHRWFIKQKRYCEHRGCLMKLEKATKVVNVNGKDYAYCNFHGYTPRLENDWYSPKLKQT